MLKSKLIFISTLMIIVIFSITGCKSSNTSNNDVNPSPPRVVNPENPYSLEDLESLTPEQTEKVLNQFDYINKFQSYNNAIANSMSKIVNPTELNGIEEYSWATNTHHDLVSIWNTLNENRLSVPISISKKHNEFMENYFNPYQKEVDLLFNECIYLTPYNSAKVEQIYKGIRSSFSKYTEGLNEYTNFLIDLLEK